jgi:putative transposase
MMLLPILYWLLCCLLGLTAVLVRRDLSKDAELLVLRHENTVLRRQISRVHYTPADRVWLAALSRLLPRRRWTEVFAVTPATEPIKQVPVADRDLYDTPIPYYKDHS